MSKPARAVSLFLQNLALRGLFGAALMLPWSARLKTVGFLTARVVAPLAGYGRRVRDNLALVCPDLPEAEVRRLMRAVPASAGRTLIEVYSGAEFKARAAQAEICGAGLEALEAAVARGQGVLLVSGHFGNYDVARAVLSARGHQIGALYRPFNNPRFDAHYRATIGAIAEPIFRANDRKSLAQMLRFLRGGGISGMLIDVHSWHYPVLRFFGKPACTSLGAAEIALKNNLLLVPFYGLRLDDRGGYRLTIEAPVAHSDAATMTQALNDSLEAQVRAHMDQWFWIHKRWKAVERA